MGLEASERLDAHETYSTINGSSYKHPPRFTKQHSGWHLKISVSSG